MKKFAVLVALLSWCLSGCALSQENYYAGVLGGFAILSGDARAEPGPSGTSLSVYKPETGPALNLFVGRDLSDIFSVQANYIWNANDLTLTSSQFDLTGETTYQEKRDSSQQSVVGDLLVYFRRRSSRVRPYLSGGLGFVRLNSSETEVTTVVGPAILPPENFSDVRFAVRVAVGVDIALRGGWAFRYSFSETMSSNPVSDQLTPPGQGSLKDFQNLFGIVKRF